MDLHWSMVFRLILAAALGAFVGYERERLGKPAGIRTYGMVSLGAALFTVVSLGGFAAGDPARIAAQVVTGIGFIGAGAILHRGSKVQGLTTAASLWVAAAIGVSVGVGMFLMSSVATALVFALLRFGPRVPPGSGASEKSHRG